MCPLHHSMMGSGGMSQGDSHCCSPQGMTACHDVTCHSNCSRLMTRAPNNVDEADIQCDNCIIAGEQIGNL